MRNKCCKTCKFSRWWLSEKGKISQSPNAYGHCVVPVVMQPLPICITKAYGFKAEFNRQIVRKNDGEDCPLWQENEGPPIKEGTP